MQTKTFDKRQVFEFILWIFGVLGILLVLINQNTVGGTGVLTKQYFPHVLLASVFLIGSSLFLKIQRERKKRYFSIWMHSREILRTIAALGFAIYALIQNN